MGSWRGHLKTITAHKLRVMRLCFRVGLYKQGLLHDLSKYGPTEFLVGARYYQGDHSPNEAERLATGVSTAWLHHKGRNKHHIEYWTDYGLGPEKQVVPVEMPPVYVAEMLCDRIAASRIYKKDEYTDASPYEYYTRSKERGIIHPNTHRLLTELLTMLKDEGEDATFEYVRKNLLKKSGRK